MRKIFVVLGLIIAASAFWWLWKINAGRSRSGNPVQDCTCAAGYQLDVERWRRVLAWHDQSAQAHPGSYPAWWKGRLAALKCACFGTKESMLVAGGTPHLLSNVAEWENAARLAHLLHHQQFPPWTDGAPSGLPSDAGAPASSVDSIGPDCDVRVQRALRREAQAHAFEIALRRQFRARLPPDQAKSATSRYRFEEQTRTLNQSQTEAFLFRYFSEYPAGDGTTPGFVLQYTARCRR